jgi:hypothetical protein
MNVLSVPVQRDAVRFASVGTDAKMSVRTIRRNAGAGFRMNWIILTSRMLRMTGYRPEQRRTIEQDLELVELYKSGLTVRQVAIQIGRGRTATQVRLHQLGVRLRGGRDRERKKTDGGDINERSCF